MCLIMKTLKGEARRDEEIRREAERHSLLYPFLISHCLLTSTLHKVPGPSQDTQVVNLKVFFFF